MPEGLVTDPKTHYEIMGLAQDATPEQVKRRFRELARKFHPDLHPDRPEFHAVLLRINQAYDVLSDVNRRASYDLTLRDQARRQAERRAGAFGSTPAGHASPGGIRQPGPAR